jgi:hypothetical protein
VSDHHHNLLALVQFFLDVTSRGRWVLLLFCLLLIHFPLGPAGIQNLPHQPQQTSRPISKPPEEELKIQFTNEFFTSEKNLLFLIWSY